MPTLSHADFLHGSADAALLDRRTLVLPCSICSAPGPHSHRLEREWGIVVVCRQCQPEVEDQPGHDSPDVLHRSPSAAR